MDDITTEHTKTIRYESTLAASRLRTHDLHFGVTHVRSKMPLAPADKGVPMLVIITHNSLQMSRNELV